MTIEATLWSRLTSHAGLSALVGDRVYPVRLPPKPTLPAITYARVSEIERVRAMGSDPGLVRARFQLDAWAEDYPTARSVALEITRALNRWSTTTGTTVQDSYKLSDIDIYEPEAELHHAALDFEIVYEEN